MPRQFTLSVVPYPALVDRLYLTIVRAVGRHPSGQLQVVLEHLSDEQNGRSHCCLLPLPVHPAGLTARFFGAVGLKPELGATITPAGALGKTLLVRFEAAISVADDYRPVAFEPAPTSTEEGHVK